jgi:hypothetical protein
MKKKLITLILSIVLVSSANPELSTINARNADDRSTPKVNSSKINLARSNSTNDINNDIQSVNDWHIYTVDAHKDIHGVSSALDQIGYPHISYSTSNTDLKYAYWDGKRWHIEEVDIGANNITGISMALDKDGLPHISYKVDHVYPVDEILYAYRDDNSWQIRSLNVVNEGIERTTSLDLDSNDYPHIVYYVWSGIGLQMLFQDENGWKTDNLCGGRYPSMVLNNNDFLHISSYSDYDGGSFTGRRLEYIYYEDGFPCQGEIVDEGNLGFSSSLKLDSQGSPHIGYLDLQSTGFNLKYAQFVGDQWQIDTLDDSGNVRHGISLALNQHDDPNISYYGDGKLKYFIKDESGWNNQIVDTGKSGTDYGEYDLSLAIDPKGYPHISYINEEGLKHAHLPATWVTVEPTDYILFGKPGTTPIATLTVRNRGQETDRYTITVDNNHWATSTRAETEPISSSESINLDIQVNIPTSAAVGSSDSATITLTSQSDQNVSTTATLTTYAAFTTYLPLVAK